MSFTLQKKLKQRLRSAAFWLFLLYVMVGSTLYFLQEKILFRPTTLDKDYVFQFEQSFEEVNLSISDSVLINAIHFKVENPKGIILYFHGNAGDLSRWGKITEHFTKYDYDVFVMDYRTYGKSQGKLSEQGLYDDAQYCYDYIAKHYPSEEIVIYGRSLGTGIATYLASKNPARQLLLETPYYSILDVAKHRFPIFPVKQLLKYKIPTFNYLRHVNYPVTIFHGTEDAVVPYESGRKLLNVLPENLNFVTIEGGTHNDLINFDIFHFELTKLLL